MTDDEIPDAIVCMPADRGIPLSGSVTVFCVDCKGRAWLSKSGQRLIERFPLTPAICLPCCLVRREREIAAGDEVKLSIVPGALQELLDELRDAGGMTEPPGR